MFNIERIYELEKMFSDNEYNGSGKKTFEIMKGEIPIMVSAPHSVNVYKNGEVKYAETFTGGISRYLAETTKCHAIYSSMFTEYEPNYDKENNLYKERLKEYVENENIKLLIDLHGSSKKREYAVEMGTVPVNNIDTSLHEYQYIGELIKYVFDENFKNLPTEKKEIWKNKIFTAGKQDTITKYISQNTKTACIQLEINQIYRNPNNVDEFLALVMSLTQIIQFSNFTMQRTNLVKLQSYNKKKGAL